MTVAVPLILFGVFLSALVVLILGMAAGFFSFNRKPFDNTSGRYFILIGFMYLMVVIANIGWWGGWITLAIWGVLQLI